MRQSFKDRVKAAREAIKVREIPGAELLDLGDFEVVNLSASESSEEADGTEEQDAQQDADEGAGEAEEIAQEQDGF